MSNDIKTPWKALTKAAIRKRVFDALEQNVNFRERGESVLGVPASSLDPKVFYSNAPFLNDAPFLSALVSNPNHIGCHTLGNSEPFFRGTHEIEQELVALCAGEILNAQEACDGYVAAGGTEANIQAVWMHRNFFKAVHGAEAHEIVLVCSEDSHYSVFKAADLLNIGISVIEVDPESRELRADRLKEVLSERRTQGYKYAIAFCNMMTTMYGSVDDPRVYSRVLREEGFEFKLHVDGAYGGFYLPFSGASQVPDFRNEEVASITLDAHKMVQAPYGTGIFLARKGLMQYTLTGEASYVSGADYTLSGSRSGANAIAVWMILMTYGKSGWQAKINVLANRAESFCLVLNKLEIKYFHAERSNIITMKACDVPHQVAEKFGLVPDNHHSPAWYKLVVMEHVTDQRLHLLEQALCSFCSA